MVKDKFYSVKHDCGIVSARETEQLLVVQLIPVGYKCERQPVTGAAEPAARFGFDGIIPDRAALSGPCSSPLRPARTLCGGNSKSVVG